MPGRGVTPRRPFQQLLNRVLVRDHRCITFYC
jgi:hypothetical protein